MKFHCIAFYDTSLPKQLTISLCTLYSLEDTNLIAQS